MAGSPADYTQMHLDTQAWILTGQTGEWTTGSNLISNLAVEEANVGVLGLIDNMMVFGKNPYQYVTVTDPTDGGVMWDAWEYIRKTAEDIDEESATVKWEEAVEVVRSGLDDLLSGVYGDDVVSAAVSVYEVGAAATFLREVAKLNNLFSDANTVNSSTRGMMVALLQREHLRGIDQYRAKLELEKEQARFNVLGQGGVSTLIEIMKAKKTDQLEELQAGAMLLQAAQAFYQAQRQVENDRLRIDLEDFLWDIKLYQFANSSLGAISGAAIVPAAPHPTMEVISSFASVVGALSPLIVGGSN